MNNNSPSINKNANKQMAKAENRQSSSHSSSPFSQVSQLTELAQAGAHWTQNVSSYLLLRRQKIQQAYQNQLIAEASVPFTTSLEIINGQFTSHELASSEFALNNNEQVNELFTSHADTLSQALFIVLGQELEQGNTMLLLASADNSSDKCVHIQLSDISSDLGIANVTNKDNSAINMAFAGLYLWQKQLVQSLLDNWLTVLTEPELAKLIVLLPDAGEFKKALYVNSVSRAESACLLSRLTLTQRLTQFFIQLNTIDHDSHDQLLSCFYRQLSQLPLFVSQDKLIHASQQITNQHAPIVMTLRDSQCSQRECTESVSQAMSKEMSQAISKGVSEPNTKLLKASPKQLVLWMHRNWQAEQSIISNINRLNAQQVRELSFANIDTDSLNQEQQQAIAKTNQSAFSIITGGPGTGKTYTVAQLVMAINEINQQIKQQFIAKQSPEQLTEKLTEQAAGQSLLPQTPLSIVLVAPTGKAAQRMQESLQRALSIAKVDMSLQESKTIHRLLGIGQAGVPRYNAQNPLAEDVIIVDEASMLGIELANYLLSAVKTGARLILLGDAHQLAAVEAGAVLSDLCQMPSLQACHANLIQSKRFSDDSPVGQLAKLINQPKQLGFGEQEQAIAEQQLSQQLDELFANYDQLKLTQLQETATSKQQVYRCLVKEYQDYFAHTQQINRQLVTTVSIATAMATTTKTDGQDELEKLQQLLHSFNQFRILTTGHRGHFGDDTINEVLTQAHRQYLRLPVSNLEWYHGRPVMVRKNNYNLGLYNGDIGICVQTAKGELQVYFESKNMPIAVSRLGDLEVVTAYAMTVHKSQGSEFAHLAVICDGVVEQLLSREMLYTAVTRAKEKVSIFGNLATLVNAIQKPTRRVTGLGLV